MTWWPSVSGTGKPWGSDDLLRWRLNEKRPLELTSISPLRISFASYACESPYSRATQHIFHYYWHKTIIKAGDSSPKNTPARAPCTCGHPAWTEPEKSNDRAACPVTDPSVSRRAHRLHQMFKRHKTFYLTLPSARPDGSEMRCYLSVFLSHSLVKCKPFACWSPSNWEQESGQVWPILYSSLPTKKRDALKVSMANTWQGTGGYKFGRGRKLLRILCPPNLFVFSLDTSLPHLLKAPQRGPVTQESSAKPEYVFSTAGVDRPLCLKGQRETLSLLATAASLRML